MAVFLRHDGKLQQLKVSDFKNERELQKLVEDNLDELFDVYFIASEFTTTHGGRIDTLGLGKDGSPVIIEYKYKEKDNVINQGLFYLDWLVDHKGDFKVAVEKKLGKDVKINWDNPRLILIAQSFNKYDKYAINRIGEAIELKRYIPHDKGILVIEDVTPRGVSNKVKDSKKIVYKDYDLKHHVKDKKDRIKELLLTLREEILKLDDNIREKFKKHYIGYEVSKNFTEVVVQANALKIYLDIDKKDLKDEKGLTEDCSNIGHWATGNTRFKIDNQDEIAYAMDLIKQAYDNNL